MKPKFSCVMGSQPLLIQLNEGGVSLCDSSIAALMLFQGFQQPVLGLALLSSEEEREFFKTGVCNVGFILQLNQLFLLLKANKTFKLFHNLERVLNRASLARKQILEFYNAFI